MAIGASFVATEGEFPLAEVFSKFPAAQIELDRVVPTSEVIVPYYWLRDVDVSEVEMRGIDHLGIDGLRVVDEVEGDGCATSRDLQDLSVALFTSVRSGRSN